MQLQSASERNQALQEGLVPKKGRARAEPSVLSTLIGYSLLSPLLTCSFWLATLAPLPALSVSGVAVAGCFLLWLEPGWSWPTSVVCPSACGPGHPTQPLVLPDSLGNEEQWRTKHLKTLYIGRVLF